MYTKLKKARRLLVGCIAVLAVLPAAASAAEVPVQSLSGDFSATNSTVTKGPDGVHFGTYADAGALGGTLYYTGFNGHALGELTNLTYTFTHRAGFEPGAGTERPYTSAPYLRVFLDVDDDGAVDTDVVLDPGNCAFDVVEQSVFHTLNMVGYEKLRYDDDGCNSLASQASWEDIVEAHGDEVIVGILVSQGNSVGTDVSALLTSLTVNDTTFRFDVPPVGPTQIIERQTIIGGPMPSPVPPPGNPNKLPTQCTSKRSVTVSAAKGASFANVSYVNGKGKRVLKKMTFRSKTGRLKAKVSFVGRTVNKGAVTTVTIRSTVDGDTLVSKRAYALCAS